MRISTGFLSLLLIAFTGCVTLPDPVPESYLVEKSSEDEKVLEKIEKAIIAKNKHKKSAQKKAIKSSETASQSKDKLALLEKEMAVLKETEKQYENEKNMDKLSELKGTISKKNEELDNQQIRTRYDAAVNDVDQAAYEVIEAELSVLVAELSYAKSIIAKAYLLKNQEKSGKKKKGIKTLFSPGPEKYDEKYKKFLDKQKEILTGKVNSHEEAKVKLRTAQDDLSKIKE